MELDFGHTEDGGRKTDGWTDRRGSQNIYLDAVALINIFDT